MRLIDADALMQEFAEFVRHSNNSDYADIPTWNDAVSLVGTAPTIDPVKHGRWEEKEVINDRKDAKIPQWQSAKCSVCGSYHTTPYLYYFDHFKFCPDCGARMDEVTE